MENAVFNKGKKGKIVEVSETRKMEKEIVNREIRIISLLLFIMYIKSGSRSKI